MQSSSTMSGNMNILYRDLIRILIRDFLFKASFTTLRIMKDLETYMQTRSPGWPRAPNEQDLTDDPAQKYHEGVAFQAVYEGKLQSLRSLIRLRSEIPSADVKDTERRILTEWIRRSIPYENAMVFSIAPRESSGSRYYQVLGLVYQKYYSFSATRPFLSCLLSSSPARRTLPFWYMRTCTGAASASVTTNGTPLFEVRHYFVRSQTPLCPKSAPL
ncbi:uncharacterized protein MKK02DRAFT_31331 [Dioszegia hungarica]|uniref:Uncharacterized protein n=1 Tax=Dioszegia hungarica TaxID=4972 RepID=A0AA38LVW2_9TREE|nr:uncharacterized protein MKK02DRAFT_31331 [Dioszegia hungarica]KAI9637755.1 hypothetical protein MKK02DRAFT_31331 [Dioszegia hungarica]